MGRVRSACVCCLGEVRRNATDERNPSLRGVKMSSNERGQACQGMGAAVNRFDEFVGGALTLLSIVFLMGFAFLVTP